MRSDNSIMDKNNFLEELITTEVSLKNQQLKLGRVVITYTTVVCLGVVLLAILSGGLFNHNAPNGATAQIILSEQFAKLIVILTIPFTIGLTAGIILIKASVKHIAKSYCNAVVSVEKFLSEQDAIQRGDNQYTSNPADTMPTKIQ